MQVDITAEKIGQVIRLVRTVEKSCAK